MIVTDVLERLNKGLEANSVLIGMLILANLIANTVSMIINIPNIFAIIVTLIAVVSIIKTGIRISYRLFFLILIIFSQFIISFLLINSSMTNNFFVSFISIGIPSMIVASKPFCTFKVIETIQMIALFCSPYVIKIIVTEYSIYDSGMLMGIGYAILPVIISSILILFESKRNKLKIIALINLILSVSISTKLISRGFFISILLFIILFTFYKVRNKPSNILKVFIITLLLFIIYIIFFHDYVVDSEWYYSLFKIKSEDFLNGRLFDYQNIMKQRPFLNILFGSGIGSYYANYGYNYIHNIIGMVYYEQGVFLSLIIVGILGFSVFKFFTSKANENRILILILLSTSVIRLMVSYYFWIDQIFWIYLSTMLSYKYINQHYAVREDNRHDKSVSCNTNV